MSTIYLVNIYLNMQVFHHSSRVHHAPIRHVCIGEYFPCFIFCVIPMKCIVTYAQVKGNKHSFYYPNIIACIVVAYICRKI